MKLIPKIIIFCYLLLLFFTPLIFTSFNSELFELPKMYFVLILTIIIFSLHLVNHLTNHVPLFRRSFLDFPLVLFLIFQTISTIISVDPHTSLFGYYSRMNGGLLSTISYLILYWVLNVYITDSLKDKLISASLLSGLLVSIYGILEHFGIDKHLWVQDVQNRVFSTLGQPNWLAAYLCILLPFAIGKFLSAKNLISKSGFLFLVSSFYVCLLFTKSKSGILAAIISITIFFTLSFFKKILFINHKSYIIVLVIFIISLTITNPIKDRIFPSSTKPIAVSSPMDADTNVTSSENIRKIVWQGALDLWKRFPLLGTGVETFAYSYYWTRPSSHNLTSEWDFLYNKAHNEYLNYLSTTGAIGLFTYLLIIFVVLKKLIIKDLTIFSSFIAILITNFAGFSVVTSSIFFFLLPVFIETKPKIIIQKLKTKNNFFTIPLIIIVLVSGLYCLNFVITSYLADVAYAQSENVNTDQKPEVAYDYISAAIKLRPSEPLYQSKLSIIAAKMAAADLQQKDEYIKTAIQASDKSVSISPANVNFWKERAQMFIYLSTVDTKYFPDSIEALLNGSRLAPTDAKFFYLLGRFYLTAGKTPEALFYFQKAIDLKPNYDHAFFDMGKIYFDQKDYQKAKELFEMTIKIAPKNTAAQDYLNRIKSPSSLPTPSSLP